MIKVIRWLLWLVGLVAVGYLVVAVPIGGQTLWERIRGGSSRPQEASPKEEGAAPQKNSAKATEKPQTDQLNETDRKALDDLIRSKLPSQSPQPGKQKS